MTAPIVRLRLDFAPACSLGLDKITLLEGIGRTGSLSQAARELGISYRRAWLLLASLNTSFRERVAVTATGGQGGGGARVTRFGQELIAAYRAFEEETQVRAVQTLKTITAKARRSARVASPASVGHLALRAATAN